MEFNSSSIVLSLISLAVTVWICHKSLPRSKDNLMDLIFVSIISICFYLMIYDCLDTFLIVYASVAQGGESGAIKPSLIFALSEVAIMAFVGRFLIKRQTK